MNKIEKFKEILPEGMKRVENINLIKVIDYSTFQDIIEEEYYIIDNKYGSKLYRDIGLRSYGYMRILNQIDSQIGNRLILDRIKTTRYEIFRNRENRLIILSKRYREEIERLKNKLIRISDKYPEIYELRKSSRISYLMKNNRRGYLIETDLIGETINIYLIKVIEREYMIIDKYSESANLREEDIEEIEEIEISGYYRDIEKRYYSIEELEKIEKKLSIDNLPEGDRERIGRLNEYRKKIEFSRYSVKDLYKWIYNNLERIETEISGFFIEVEEERLAFDRMKESI